MKLVAVFILAIIAVATAGTITLYPIDHEIQPHVIMVPTREKRSLLLGAGVLGLGALGLGALGAGALGAGAALGVGALKAGAFGAGLGTGYVAGKTLGYYGHPYGSYGYYGYHVAV